MQLRFAGVQPIQATPEAAGFDLIATFDHHWSSIDIEPGERRLIGTGTYVEIPPGYVGLLVPRSGKAIREGLSVVNSPGIIDSDYRGEVKVAVINENLPDPRDIEARHVRITSGERIAQLVIVPVPEVELVHCQISDFSTTERGAGGFGSTGR